tara:strand:+ start:709 stop:1053 length:345 start_codon:yes stop_codon:yes gene_type:complete
MDITQAILFFSAISFIVYGINSFFSRRMVLEYERWGFKNQRVLLGCCQLLGGLGLLVGLKAPLMLSVASFLLFCMMVTAVFVRIRIKERIVQILPALLYVVLTFVIFYHSVAQP